MSTGCTRLCGLEAVDCSWLSHKEQEMFGNVLPCHSARKKLATLSDAERFDPDLLPDKVRLFEFLFYLWPLPLLIGALDLMFYFA